MSATHPGLLAAVGLASATAAVWTPRLADHLTRTPHAVNTAVGGPWRRSLTAAGVAGLTGTVLVWRLPTTPVPAACLLAAWLLFLQAGLLLTIADLETRRLPTSAIAATAAAASVLLLIGAAAGHDPGPILAALTGAALVGGTYLALAVLTPGWPPAWATSAWPPSPAASPPPPAGTPSYSPPCCPTCSACPQRSCSTAAAAETGTSRSGRSWPPAR
ncbi:hypothetical protein GCM10020218_024220 [Dactylosporangium vinaceum]